jgi:hypothetical protein
VNAPRCGVCRRVTWTATVLSIVLADGKRALGWTCRDCINRAARAAGLPVPFED